MINPGLIFNEVLVRPIITVLVAIYHILFFLHVPYTLGFSIIVLTIVIRLILYPFVSSQLKVSKKMQELAPHLSRLKNQHKGDSSRLQQETMKLYKEHNINPAAGCLPVLFQIPIIWGLYSVLQQVVVLKQVASLTYVNKLVFFDFLKLSKPWDVSFFGIPLGQQPKELYGSVGVLILLVPFITGFSQFIQSKMMLPSAPKVPVKLRKEEKKKDISQDDFSSAFQSQSMYIFPVMIGFFSFTFAIGLSLYWNTFTIFGIIQQYRLSGWGGLGSWKDKISGFTKILANK